MGEFGDLHKDYLCLIILPQRPQNKDCGIEQTLSTYFKISVMCVSEASRVPPDSTMIPTVLPGISGSCRGLGAASAPGTLCHNILQALGSPSSDIANRSHLFVFVGPIGVTIH